MSKKLRPNAMTADHSPTALKHAKRALLAVLLAMGIAFGVVPAAAFASTPLGIVHLQALIPDENSEYLRYMIETTGKTGEPTTRTSDFLDKSLLWTPANPDELSSADWMSGIPGERRLNEINIPCTHDSGCMDVDGLGVGADWAQTQVRYIDEQLADGVRKLDIRLNNWHEIDGGIRVEDDGESLWLCHGKTLFGTYWCKNHQGDDLSLSEVLEWTKAFLADHPTETVVMDFEAELNDSLGYASYGRLDEDKAIVWNRANSFLNELASETNPSTGKPYLYLESEGANVSDLFSRCPQLKDCRGQLVIKHSSDTVGGLDWGHMGITEESEGENDVTAYEKIELVNKFYGDHECIEIPRDATTHLDKVYNVGTTTSGTAMAYTSDFSPVDYAEDVHSGCKEGEEIVGTIENATENVPIVKHLVKWGTEQVQDLVADEIDGLFVSGSVFDQRGRYVGWVRLDGATPKVDAMIWKSNFCDNMEMRKISVQPGHDTLGEDLKEEYGVLAGTEITVPSCIYNYDKNVTGGDFKGWKVKGETVDTTVQPGETFSVTEDVEFMAQWG
ncbi:MAG: hypothetical protein Q4B54_08320 [Coriobacteriales bacterium]|nr:hypothetical protein [Coriobacteriales bacterium]